MRKLYSYSKKLSFLMRQTRYVSLKINHILFGNIYRNGASRIFNLCSQTKWKLYILDSSSVSLDIIRACDKFKKHSHLCCQVGLLLSGKGVSPIVWHFGLQLIEHCIKFRWNNMHQDDKVFIKGKALELLESGTRPVMMEEAYIKDALSRIIVEMIKREWPQQCPCLLQELCNICSLGETQTELVLLIFLRLAEDIVIFKNVQNQCHRLEIHQTLTSRLKDLFPFFLCTLNNQYAQYTLHKQGPEDFCKQQKNVQQNYESQIDIKNLPPLFPPPCPKYPRVYKVNN